MNVEFDNEFPEMIRGQIESLLDETKWILPVWLQTLYVGWCGDDQDSTATMKVDKDYRFARLTVCGHFLANTARRQKEIVYHEFLHVHISPVIDYAKEIVSNVVKDNDLLKDYLDRELTRYNEQAAQDLAFAITNKINDKLSL